MNPPFSALTWVAVGRLADIPRRGARCVLTPLGKIGVFRTGDDQLFAIADHCPHKGGPLTQGIVHGASVTCPLHNWVIDLATGRALGADEGQVPTIPVRLAGDVIELGLDGAEFPAPAPVPVPVHSQGEC